MKKIILFTVNFLILIISAVCIDSHDAYAETEYELSNPTYDADRDYAEWDCIYFGWYPQDSADENDLQPVKWRVLSVEENDALLISDKMLFPSEFIFHIMSGTTWKASSLRGDLRNFKLKAFTEEEKESIITVNVNNKSNPDYPEYEDDEDTTESVYVLSYDEACNPKYGFCADPKKQSKTRQAAITKYAVSNGNVIKCWWLRTPGMGKIKTTNVFYNGQINSEGTILLNDVVGKEKDYLAVRPVLHLDITNTNVWSYAGKATSDDERPEVEKDIPTPTPLPTNIPTQSPQQDLTVTPSAVPSVPVLTPVKQPDITVQADRTFESGKLMYKVISGGKNKVYVCGVRKGKKQVKAVEIPGKVYRKGTSYKVTGIEANAFVKCRKLKRVTIKSKTLKYIGKNAFRKGKNKPVIKMPEKQYKRYCRLLKKSVK